MTIHQAAKRAAAAIDQERLWRRHMAMAEIGKIPGGGVSRQALSGDDIRARALLLEWAGARGYRPAVDDIANLFIRRSGRDAGAAPVVAGSHMDSQPAGGRFDGIFGVLAGLEALEALDDAGIATDAPDRRGRPGPTRRVAGSRRAPWARRCSPGTCGSRTVSH